MRASNSDHDGQQDLLLKRAARIVRRCARRWNVAQLLQTPPTIKVSTRLKRRLAVASPLKNRVHFNVCLLECDIGFIEEIVCHEVAHLVAYLIHGPRIKPHGKEWRELVIAAGHRPVVRYKTLSWSQSGAASVSPKTMYVHTCPACHFSRRAKRAMRQWRCPVCRALGLEGHLCITTVPVREKGNG